MIGMMCARYNVDPLGQQRGFDGERLVCFVSEESHYSVLMSANVLGIGFDNVIKVPCDTTVVCALKSWKKRLRGQKSIHKSLLCNCYIRYNCKRGL